MTRKATLQRWANGLGADFPAPATVQELEQAIENAIATPADEPQYSLRDGLVNNLQVLRAEALPTARAVASNLFG